MTDKTLIEKVQNLKLVSKKLANLSTDLKNSLLIKIAELISQNRKEILTQNKIDLDNALNCVSDNVYNRLKLDDFKIDTMISSLKNLAKLDDPINKKLFARELDKGLNLYKISCPIGVLAVIFEARPDVITQVTGLAVKSSNALILKGGKEVFNTNKFIFNLILKAIDEIKDYPKNSIIQIYSRDEVSELLSLDEYIDLIIPRGGNSLVKYIKDNTKIPVLGHASGICHIFVDEYASLDMASNIIIDAKTQYPSACNSVETALIHKNFKYIEKLISNLKNSDIEIIENPADWAYEYSAKKLSIKIVDSIDDAIFHINKYGSGHTDSIVTDNIKNAEKFLNEVDSSGVYHNVSTRFADGYRYGFGAEVGISTNKIHARGPVGLDGLTIYKYKLYGEGQIVKDYVEGRKHFSHVDL